VALIQLSDAVSILNSVPTSRSITLLNHYRSCHVPVQDTQMGKQLVKSHSYGLECSKWSCTHYISTSLLLYYMVWSFSQRLRL